MDEVKANAFYGLQERCYRLAECKLILARGKIEAILAWIAENPPLVDFFRQNCDNINFFKELDSCYIYQGNMVTFVLPASHRLRIVLVLGILDEFEKDTIRITDFLSSIYPSMDMNSAFVRFQGEFILPFVDSVYALFADETPIEQQNTEKTTVVQQELLAVAEPLLQELNGYIQGDNYISDNERAEYNDIVTGFYHALNEGSDVLIKTCFLSLDARIRKNRNYKKVLHQLELLLRGQGLL